ncbi:Mu phage minor capsid protein GpF [Catenovulum agarivorans DS-2]|uniref:Mu phage minor capsid protein GpF n=1 Tax=Catenovulum agarivorans DS-2 TaxID=1328313 RepID=W7QAL4_9ALTE|nr:phage minor head protein [Catenovulum agarivorans]EWH09854.1 Mu phage minor capsid protein GpF [Catenovulum agarivorans DS-2]
MPTVDLQTAFKQPPKDAVAYFRSKGFTVSDNWWEVWQGAHAKAFTVAKAMRMDVLEDIRKGLDQALAQGKTAKQFTDELAPLLKNKGWWGKQIWADSEGNAREVQLGSYHRLRNIYRINLQTAYMSGRYRRQLEGAKTRPYWMYVAILDGQTRPTHRTLNGKVFRFDDPIWQVIYPPNGWGCRCRVRALTEAQVKRMGLQVEQGEQYIQDIQAEAGTDKTTGEVIEVDHKQINLPNGKSMRPDVGWAHNPGEAAFGTDMAIAQKIGRVQDIDLRSQTIQALNNSPEREAVFRQWVSQKLQKIEKHQELQAAREFDRLREIGMTPEASAVVGFLPDDVFNYLADKKVNASRVVMISERQLAHANRPKHKRDDVDVPLHEYENLVDWINNSNAQILFEPAGKALIYVIDKGDEAIKVVVSFNAKNSKGLDMFITTYRTPMDSVKSDILGGKLEVIR